jgi:predicted transcriptional regulator
MPEIHHVLPDLYLEEPVATDLMCTSVLAVEATETVGMAVELAARLGVHHLPVLHGGRCVGVIDDRELLAARLQATVSGRPALVGDLPGLTTAEIGPYAPLSAVAATLLEEHTDALLVRTADGDVVGLITVHDVVRAMAHRPPRRPYAAWSQSAALFTIEPVLPAQQHDSGVR